MAIVVLWVAAVSQVQTIELFATQVLIGIAAYFGLYWVVFRTQALETIHLILGRAAQ